MIKTADAKMSKLSSLFQSLSKIDKLNDKVKALQIGSDIDSLSAIQAFTIYKTSKESKMFRNDIIDMVNSGKIMLKHNPLVGLGLYMPYVPEIKENGSVRILVNATSYATDEDGQFKMNPNDLLGLLQGAYAMYKCLNKYQEITSNQTYKKTLFELYYTIFFKGVEQTSIFTSSLPNTQLLRYILAKYVYVVHYGTPVNEVHNIALTLAYGSPEATDTGKLSEVLLNSSPEQWLSLQGIVDILIKAFPTVKGKISVDIIRTRVAILLGSPAIHALDYIPYVMATAAGYYSNFAIYRNNHIKKVIGEECIKVNGQILVNL